MGDNDSDAEPEPRTVALVTGANTGVGFETALQLAGGGRFDAVVIACRSAEKAADAADLIRVRGVRCEVACLPLDLSSLASAKECARAFVERYPGGLDALVLNAGVNRAGTESGLTDADVLEFVFQVNFLGHALLARELVPSLRKRGGVVVSVSSVMHRAGELDFAAAAVTPHFRTSYRTSKLAQVLWTGEFNRRHRADGLLAVAVSPGAVNSEIWRHEGACARRVMPLLRSLVFLTPAQGARTSVMAAAREYTPPAGDDTPYLAPYWVPDALPLPFAALGPWFRPGPCRPAARALGAADGAALWELTEHLLRERGFI